MLSRKKCLFYFFMGLAVAGGVPQTALSAVTQTAVVATAASDFSSGAHSVISGEAHNRSVQDDILPAGSDVQTVSFGRYYYRIEKFMANHITKFDIADPDTDIWQFSTDVDESNSNPHDIIFASPTKAYVLRYGSPKAWIVNPSAKTETDFKIGELDLSHYEEGDGNPEMHSGIIVDGKLFITLQRIDFRPGWGNYVYHDSWVAVYDIDTDTEIDTGRGNGTLKGIQLIANNAHAIQYCGENNSIYVQGTGNYNTDPTSGIDRIDLNNTYAVSSVIDDSDDQPQGAISGMTIVSPTKGYFVGYAGWGDTSLYPFNPTTGVIESSIDGLKNKSIGGMATGIYPDKDGFVWVCNSTDERVDIINPTSDSVVESIPLSLCPLNVAFVLVGTVDDDDDHDGIPDAQEIVGNVDLDNDGINDVFDASFKAIETVTNKQAGLKASVNVQAILTLTSVDLSTITEQQNKPDEMPFGLFDFSLQVPSGAEAQVEFYFSEAVPAGSKWFKYMDGAWEDYSAHVVFSSDMKSATVAYKDGGFGDADGLINGVIVDPSGPGTKADASSGDSTCFISSASQNGQRTGAIAWILLVTATMIGACSIVRRKQYN